MLVPEQKIATQRVMAVFGGKFVSVIVTGWPAVPEVGLSFIVGVPEEGVRVAVAAGVRVEVAGAGVRVTVDEDGVRVAVGVRVTVTEEGGHVAVAVGVDTMAVRVDVAPGVLVAVGDDGVRVGVLVGVRVRPGICVARWLDGENVGKLRMLGAPFDLVSVDSWDADAAAAESISPSRPGLLITERPAKSAKASAAEART